jgi:hypothetical protein
MACSVLVLLVSVWIVRSQGHLFWYVHRLRPIYFSLNFVIVSLPSCYGTIFWNFNTWWWGWFPLLVASTPVSLIHYVTSVFKTALEHLMLYILRYTVGFKTSFLLGV